MNKIRIIKNALIRGYYAIETGFDQNDGLSKAHSFLLLDKMSATFIGLYVFGAWNISHGFMTDFEKKNNHMVI